MPLLAASASVLAVLLLNTMGPAIAFGALLAPTLLVGSACAFVRVPHIAIAVAIPLFAATSALRIFVSVSLGPVKDVVVLGAAIAVAYVAWSQRGRLMAVDRWLLAATGLFLSLYIINAGGGHNVAWFHTTRLFGSALVLLAAGMILHDSRRNLRWAMYSLIATAVVNSLIGLAQQAVGLQALLDLGYTYDKQAATIGGNLRSFGTFEGPFQYTTFLLFGLAAVMFWMPAKPYSWILGVILCLGIATSFTRTGYVIAFALVGLWLARDRHPVIATTFGVVVVTIGIALLVNAEATQSRTVRTGEDSGITLNGRTTVWAATLGDVEEWPFGRGVGVVGTGAERAASGLGTQAQKVYTGPATGPPTTVDSGYFNTLADVGIVGLGVLLAMLGRMGVLARSAIRDGMAVGWLTAAFLVIILLDAVTRSSFNSFPASYIGMLLVGLTIGAAVAARRGSDPPTPPRPRFLDPIPFPNRLDHRT